LWLQLQRVLRRSLSIAEATESAQDIAKAKAKRRRIILIAVPIVVVLAIAIVLYWFVFVRGYETTDDAYTDGRAIPIAAKVAGYVKVLAINDNQSVNAGDLLLEIDPADYQVALANAEANVNQAKAELESASLDLQVQQTSTGSNLSSAEAASEQARANLDKALADQSRQQAVNPLATTLQQTDQITALAVVQRMQLKDADAKLRTAKLAPQNIAIAAAKVRQLEAQLQGALSQLDQARLNLGYTQIRAPQTGHVTQRNVERGSYVQVGQSLTIIVADEVWITANYKEDQLAHMHQNQPVTIRVDAYPDLRLSGHVDSEQFGSGSRFSAFPAENATGNFVKIVQRFPVKIIIDKGLDPNRPLPLGASVEPSVDVR